MANKKLELPMIPLRGMSVFPGMVVHFDIGREKSISALEDAVANEKQIFLISQRDINKIENFSKEDLYKVGTICNVKQVLKLPGNNARVLTEGITRARLESMEEIEGYIQAKITEMPDKDYKDDDMIKAHMRSVMSAFEEYVTLENRVSPEIFVVLADIEDPGRFADLIAGNLILKPADNQEILECIDVDKRLAKLHKIIVEENKILNIQKKLNQNIRKEMNKNEKEYYLKQQMRAIQDELGYQDSEGEVEDFREKLDALEIPDETREKIEKEIDKYARSSKNSADSEVSRNYLETFFDLPWNESTDDHIDLDFAEEVLNEDHFGLEKVKERIIEYLAVKKLSNSMKGPIICLVGPPGVGKTSIGKSIARAQNRNFQRISLGGVRDEAEIRGHRRTYVGAIPGRIINALTQAKSNNPVILFDEIDKMSMDFKGDPSAALLEVLDSEQNENFTDHYMEVPFDLSNVMFLATANSLQGVPRPLIDRMEIIEVSGYTEQEKLEITKGFLIPKQLKEHALSEKFLSISDETLLTLISKYTRESGVRGLERQIGKICRKAAKRKVDKPGLKYLKITDNTIGDYLGKEVFDYEMMNNEPQVGIVRGLAWTQVGGDTLSIEVNTMAGSGKLVLTGQLGDVMQESAKTALSYVRSISEKYPIDKNFYKNTDIHMHIPEGATPKDGPSAGITMATAITSALSGIPVRNDIAMTGEITLRGRALPIGGVKEKLLAAHRAGIMNILIPSKNEKDLEDIPEEIRKTMNIKTVENMEEVLEEALSFEDFDGKKRTNSERITRGRKSKKKIGRK